MTDWTRDQGGSKCSIRVSSKDLILSAIRGDTEESRYILLLTKNNAALRIIQEQNICSSGGIQVLYGSSFPHDQVKF